MNRTGRFFGGTFSHVTSHFCFPWQAFCFLSGKELEGNIHANLFLKVDKKF
jgi:hypothetical protein